MKPKIRWILLFLLMAAASVRANSVYWTNLNGGNWNVAANWAINGNGAQGVPLSTDTALIVSNGNYIVTNNASPTISGLTLGGSSGTQSLSNNANLVLNGAGTSTASAVLNFNGSTLSGTGSLVANGPLYLNGVTVTLAGGVTANDTLSFSGNPQINGANVMLVNNGTANFSSPTYIYLYNGATFSNSATFNWTNTGNTSFQNSGALGVFANTGTVNFSASAGDTGSIIANFNNSGSGVVHINGGTLALVAGGSTASGAGFNIASGATLEVNNNPYTFNAGSTITDGGLGGNLTVASSTANFNGTVSLSGTYTVSGGLANFAGIYDITSALNITGGTAIFTGGTGTVTPASMILSGTLGGSFPVTVSGAMTFNGGIITNTGGVVANGTLSFSGNSQVNGPNVMLVNNGTANFSSPTYIYLYNGATFSNSATFNWTNTGNTSFQNSGALGVFANTGTVNFSASAGDTGSIIANFNNSGSGVVHINGGTLALVAGGSTASGAGFNIASGATLEVNNNPYTFNAGSTITDGGLGGNLTVASSTANFNGTVSLSGTYTVSGGLANFAGIYDITSALNITGGTAIFTGGTGTVTPASMILSGTLGGSFPVTVSGAMTFNGGIITNTGGVVANGTLSFSGNSQVNGPNVMLVNNGTANFSSPTYIYLYNGATFSNSATFNWTNTGNTSFQNSGALGVFANTGTVNFSASAGDTGSIIANFNNSGSGVVHINGGTLALVAGGSTASGAGFNIASGATLEVNNNPYTFNAGSTITDGGLGGNLTVASSTANFNGTVSLSGTYTVSGGLANFAGIYDITSALNITGGTAIFTGGTGTVTPASMILSGTLGGSFPVTVSGAMTFNGGIITNTGGVVANGTLSFSGNSQVNGPNVMLVNNGTANFSTPTYIELYNGATFSNSATFNWTNTGNTSFQNSGALGVFANTGTVNFSASAGDTGSIIANFNNSGSGVVHINGGTLSLSGGGSSASGTTLNVASSATLAIGGGSYTFSAGSTIEGAGTLDVSSGIAYLNGAVTVNTVTVIGTAICGASGSYTWPTLNLSGYLGGTTPVNVSGAMTFNGGEITNNGGVTNSGTLSISGNPEIAGAGVMLVNNGTANWNSGSAFYVYGGATLSNSPSGIFNWTTTVNGTAVNGSGAGNTFANTGTLNFSAPSADYGSIAIVFNNSGAGVVNVNGGTLYLSGNGTDSSSSATGFDVASGATLSVNGGTYTFNAVSTVMGAGTLLANSGIAYLNGAVTVNTVTVIGTAICGASGSYTWPTLNLSGYLGGTTPVNVSGAMTFNGGEITNNGGVTNSGTLSISGNPEIAGAGVMLVNIGTATWSAGSAFYVYGGATLSNSPSGIFNWTTTVNGTAVNGNGAGNTFANMGTLNFSAPSADYGSIAIVFNNSGAGVVNVNGGTLYLSGNGTDSSSSATGFDVASGATLSVNGGTYTFNAVSTVMGAGTLLANSGIAYLNGAVTVNTVTVIGTAICGASGSYTWPTLNLSGYLGGTTPVNVSGAMTFNGGEITNNGGVTNSGTLSISGNPEIAGAGVMLVNIGTATWSAGSAFYVYSGATLSNSPSGTMNWNLTVNGTAVNDNGAGNTFANTGTLNFSAPSGDTGSINTAFTNSGGGVVNVMGGILDFAGTHSLTNGTLNFGITNYPTPFGSATLSGAANLAGTLSATFLNPSFSPVIGDTWQVLNYTSQSGAFTKTNLPPTAVWQTTYNTANTTIKILQFVPTITWPTPSPIVYGTTLSGLLNATAVSPYPSSAALTGPGTFTYTLLPSGTPISSGTILNASNQTLSVVFTPSAGDQVDFSKATNTVNIDVRPLPVELTGTRIYDATTNVAASILTVANPVGSDSINVAAGTGGLAGTMVGSEAMTSFGTLTLGGAQAANYTLVGASGSVTITPKALTMSGLTAPPSKVYDGTTTAAVSGSPGTLQTPELAGTGSSGDGAPYDGDTVSLTGTATGTYNSKDVATATTVTFGGLSLAGAQDIDYTLTIQSPVAATITAKVLTMSGLSVPSSKVYDGTTTAAVSGSPGTLQTPEAPVFGSGGDDKPYSGDTVSLTGTATGTYNSKDVATADLVTFGGLSLSGAQQSDYTLTIQSPVTATITMKALTMSGLSVPSSKIYDGTTAAVVSGSPGTLQTPEAPVFGSGGDDKPYSGDTVSLTGTATGTYNSKDVASADLVTFGGLSLSGLQAGDYTLTIQSPATATITAKALSMSGLSVPSSKVYDGTTTAAVSGSPGALQAPETSGAGSTGDGKPYDNDTVSLSGTATGTYNSKDVATADLVTFSGLSLAGAQAGDYTLTIESSVAATITAKALTMSGLSVPSSKVYDGTTTAVVSGSPGNLQSPETAAFGTGGDGKPYGGDAVSLSGTATGTYNSKDVASADSVTFGGLSLSGLQAGDYNLTIQSPASATITAKALTMSGLSVPSSKVYDGTTAASVSGSPGTLQTPEAAGTGSAGDGKPYGGDTVSLSGSATGTYNSKDVATATTVTFGGISLAGLQAGDYTLTIQGPAAATITTKALTMSGLSVPPSKAYDGTTVAVVSGSPGNLQSPETAAFGTGGDGKPYGGDAVSLSGTATGTYNSKDVATATTVTFGGVSLAGLQAGDYTLTIQSPVSATITAKALTMSGLSVPSSKVYDGTTTASVSGSPGTLQTPEAAGAGAASDGKPYSGDTVSLTGTATGTYNSKDVATADSVTFGGISLAGLQAGDYTLTIQSPASATITAKALTMSGLAVPSSKVYDGTTTAAVSGSPGTLQTLEAPLFGSGGDGKPYSGDTVSLTGTATGAYNSKDVATATTVTFGGVSLSGLQAGDYTLTIQSPASATITAKALTMSGLSVPSSKVYDGTTTAAVSGSPGSLQTPEAVLFGSGGDGKPYSGDTVSLTGTATGTYNSKDVATATTISFGGVSLSGLQAGDYTLTIQSPASATITAKALTMSGLSVPSSKVYDGTTTAAVSGSPGSLQTPEAVLFGSGGDGKPYNGDAVSLSGTATGTYNSKDVATATTVTFGGLSLSGVQAGDYTLTIQSPVSATITAKTLTMSGLSAPASKVYDGTTTATVSGSPGTLQTPEAALFGSGGDDKPYNGDAVSLTGTAIGTYNSQNVTAATTVTFSGVSLSGMQAGDYTLTIQSPAAATITPASLSITADNASKIAGQTLDLGTSAFTTSGLITGDSVTAVTLTSAGAAAAAAAASYPIMPSDAIGTGLANYSITYHNGTLTVTSSNCDPPPSGFVSWWKAEGNAIDNISGNNGTLTNGVTYVPGEVGQAFEFDTYSAMVLLGSPANLQLQNFTIEAWVQRGSLTAATSDSSPLSANALLFSYGSDGGYGFGMNASGNLLLSQIGSSLVNSSASITDTNFHHVAVTMSGSSVIFYIDGTAYPVSNPYNVTFTFGSQAAIGGYAQNINAAGNCSFLGAIDEMSVYSSVLTGAEIAAIYNAGAAGKCLPALTVTWGTPSDIVYGTPLSGTQLDATANIPGTFTYDPPAGTVLSAGQAQTLTVIFNPSDTADYSSVTQTVSINVDQAPLVITAGAQSKIYGAVLNLGTTAFTTTVLSNSDTVTSVTLSSPGAAGTAGVGGYLITPSLAVGGGLANYNITYQTGPLNVTAAPLVITAGAQSKIYGAVLNLGTTAFTTTVLSNSDTVTSVTLSSPGAAGTAGVGGYLITPSLAVGGGLANYSITYQTGPLNVTAAPLVITAGAQSKIYGAVLNLGTTAFTTTVLSNSDTVTSVTLSSPGAAGTAGVGGYLITPSLAVGGGLANYSITYQTGPLNVTAAPLVITAGAQSKIYGAVLNLGTTAFTTTVLSNSDTVTSVTLSSPGAAGTAGVGGYLITPSLAVGGGLANYNITYQTGPLNVTAAPLVVTASPQSKTSGQTLNLGTTAFTTTVLSNSDIVTGVTLTSPGAVATAGVGSYLITPSAAVGTGLANYSITYLTGTLMVTSSGSAATVTCPSDITTNQATGECSQLVAFAPIVAGSPTPTLVCELNGEHITSPYSFPVGTNTVTCTASNTGGMDNCSFTVTVVNTNPPVPGLYSLGSYQGQAITFPVAKAIVRAKAPSGGPLSITSVASPTPDGASVVMADGIITYTPPVTSIGADTITYTLSDGCGTAQGTINVTILSTNLPSQNQVSIAHNASSTTIVFAGVPGATYQVQYADALLVPWTNIGNPIGAAANGLVQYTDTTFPVPPNRYYRIQYVSGP